MRTNRRPVLAAIFSAMLAATVSAAAPAAQAQAAPAATPTVQAALAGDAGRLSDKFAGLAGAMAGKYDWRPEKGVRSVGEVFNLIVMENQRLIAIVNGTAAPSGPRPEPITDPAKMQDALRDGYANLQKAINGLSPSDLQTPVKLFGRDFTKQSALMLMLGDQHEHLGQSIAYARMNGVVPPWSK